MNIAFYLDSKDPALVDCARLAIAAARAALGCDIFHLTTPTGPVLEGVIRYEVVSNEPFGYRRPFIQSHMAGDTLFLGIDCIVRENILDIFSQDFDVAIATDMQPGSDQIKYNADVVFSRSPQFWRDVAEACRGMDFSQWEDIEGAYTRIIDSGKYRTLILPGETYNYVPRGTSDDFSGVKVVHYRGQRKRWLVEQIPFQPAEFQEGLNNDRGVMLEQFSQNIQRDLPWFDGVRHQEGPAILVGGGPSLADTWGQIKYQQFRKGTVFALNGAHDWLIEHDIIPDYHILLDSRPGNSGFVSKPHRRVRYLVSAFCHPSVFEALEGYRVMLWMNDMEGVRPMVERITDRPVCLVGGGATVGMKAMFMVYLMGFKKLHFHGFDSSYRDDANHAYQQPMNAAESRVRILAAGREFVCAPWMAKQAKEFQGQARKLMDLGCEISVFGDGLIPWIVQQWSKAA